MTEQNNKNDYAKTVSLFLAELLRTRQINIRRAAEIAQKVVANLNLLDTEQHFLGLIKELHKDFDELFPLEEKIFFKVKITEREDMEHKVKLFAITIMSSDLDTAHNIMQEAIKDETNFETLSLKFPQFKEFVETL